MPDMDEMRTKALAFRESLVKQGYSMGLFTVGIVLDGFHVQARGPAAQLIDYGPRDYEGVSISYSLERAAKAR